jgi:hypothetical protein
MTTVPDRASLANNFRDSNLLEKIQRLGKQKLFAERRIGDDGKAGFPAPIKRELLV